MTKRNSTEKRISRISVVVTENLRDDLEKISKVLGISLNAFCYKSLDLAVKNFSHSVHELETAQATLEKAQSNLNSIRENALKHFEKTFYDNSDE